MWNSTSTRKSSRIKTYLWVTTVGIGNNPKVISYFSPVPSTGFHGLPLAEALARRRSGPRRLRVVASGVRKGLQGCHQVNGIPSLLVVHQVKLGGDLGEDGVRARRGRRWTCVRVRVAVATVSFHHLVSFLVFRARWATSYQQNQNFLQKEDKKKKRPQNIFQA